MARKEIITETVYESVRVKKTDPRKGLTKEEVILREGNGLSNVSVDTHTKTVKQIVKEHTLTFFNLVMVAVAFCLLIAGQFKDTLFLLVAVVNTVIGIVQELRSRTRWTTLR